MSPTIPIVSLNYYYMVSIVRYVHMIDEATSTIGAPYYYLWLNPLGSMSSTMYSCMEFFCFVC